jgi:hypothetical protein
MSGLRESQLIERDLTVPEALLPAAGYIPFRRSDNTLHIAGQVPRRGGKTAFMGTPGKDMSLESVAALPKGVPVEAEATIELFDVPPCVPATR